jgi:hypothetical protein
MASESKLSFTIRQILTPTGQYCQLLTLPLRVLIGDAETDIENATNVLTAAFEKGLNHSVLLSDQP